MDEESVTIKAWNSASKEYSNLIKEQLRSSEREFWLRLIYQYAPKKDKLKVLDIGTGPGFFTISLAMDGHDAIGVDLSVGMLREAELNAKEMGVQCEFRPMNANNLLFDSNTFDLIISRNVTWTLPDMMECYREWRRVLAPGGRILVFDSNFNWNFFDPIHDMKFRDLIREIKIMGVDSGTVNTGFMFRNTYMETRPMLGMPRPQWDRNMLIKMRFTNIVTKTEVLVGTELDRMPNPESPAPLFLICAEKPSKSDEERMLIKEYWNGLAPFESGRCHRFCRDRKGIRYLETFEDVLRKGDLLDVACGAGFLSIAASEKGFASTGIDSSEEMVLEARRCAEEVHSDARFVLGDAEGMEFEDGSFDSVIIRNSLWSFKDPSSALAESYRVLRPKGRLVIIDADWIVKLSTGRPAFDDDGVRIRSGETGFGGTDVIDPIFRNLPLTIKIRPDWDINECSELGFRLVKSRTFDDTLLDKSIRDIVGDSFLLVFEKD
ncbi:MAG: methyltransferase domain-containing protein [Thermoplasmata archaeon]|nr:methyltransferase domain-containing protein [Thermoplasmata archaeon]